MPEFHRSLVRGSLAFLSFACAAVAQTGAVTSADLVGQISHKYQEASHYTFAGDLEIARKDGTEKPKDLLLKAKVNLKFAIPGKYILKVNKPNGESYILQSDGEKTWKYVPSLKKYSETAAPLSTTLDDPGAGLDVRSKQKDLALEFSRLVVPILAGLAKSTDVIDLKGPLLMVLAKKDKGGLQNMTYLTIDPVTQDIRRMSWLNATPTAGGDKVLVRSDITFDSFQIGGPVNDGDFAFQVPKGVKRVDALPLGGQIRPSR